VCCTSPLGRPSACATSQAALNRFRECFAGGRFAHRWNGQQIDSRSVAMTNKAQIAAWVKDHGEDSDFICVRVRGVFPRTGERQFIDGQRSTTPWRARWSRTRRRR
jgi:hypothetical protein